MPLEKYQTVGEDEPYNRATPSSTSSFLSRYPRHGASANAETTTSSLLRDGATPTLSSTRSLSKDWYKYDEAATSSTRPLTSAYRPTDLVDDYTGMSPQSVLYAETIKARHARPRTAPGSGSHLFGDPGKSRYKSSRPPTSSWDVETPLFRDRAFSEAFKSKRDISSPRPQAWDEPASRANEPSPSRYIGHLQRGSTAYDRRTSGTTSLRYDPISGMSSRWDSGPSLPRHGTTTNLSSRWGTTPPRHDPNTGLSSRWDTAKRHESTTSLLSRVDNEMARLKQAAPMRASDNKNSTFDSSADTLGGDAFSTEPFRPRHQPTIGLSSHRSPVTSRLRHEPATVLPSRWSPGRSRLRHESAFMPSSECPKNGASGIDPTLGSDAFRTTRDPTVPHRTTPAWLMKDTEPTNVPDTEINRTRRSGAPTPSWLSDGTAAGIAFQPTRLNDIPADSDEHITSPENTPEIMEDNTEQSAESPLPEIIEEIPIPEIIVTLASPSESTEELIESNDKPEEPNKLLPLPEIIITTPTPQSSPTKTVETQTEESMVSTGKIVANKRPIIVPTARLYAPTDTSTSRMRSYSSLTDSSLTPSSTSICSLSSTEEEMLRTNYKSNFRLTRVGYLKELYRIYKNSTDLVRRTRKECERQTQLLSNQELNSEQNKKSKSDRRVKQSPINKVNDLTDTLIAQCHELMKDIRLRLLETDSKSASKQKLEYNDVPDPGYNIHEEASSNINLPDISDSEFRLTKVSDTDHHGQPGFDNSEESSNVLVHYQVGNIFYSHKSLYGQLEFPDKPVDYATNEQARVLHDQVNAAQERFRTVQEHVDSLAKLLRTSQEHVNSTAKKEFEDTTNARVRSLQKQVNSVAKVFEDTVHDGPHYSPAVVTHTSYVDHCPVADPKTVQENYCSSPPADSTTININLARVPRIGCLAAMRRTVRNFRKGCAGSAWGRFFRCCRPRRHAKISRQYHDEEFDDVCVAEPNAVGEIECNKGTSHPIEGHASSANKTVSNAVKVPKVGKHTTPIICQSSDENTEQNHVTRAHIRSNEIAPEDEETLAEPTGFDSKIVSPPKWLKRKRNKKNKKKRKPLSPISEPSSNSKASPKPNICEPSSNSKASPKSNVNVHSCKVVHEEAMREKAKALEKPNVQITFVVHSDSDTSVNRHTLINDNTHKSVKKSKKERKLKQSTEPRLPKNTQRKCKAVSSVPVVETTAGALSRLHISSSPADDIPYSDNKSSGGDDTVDTIKHNDSVSKNRKPRSTKCTQPGHLQGLSNGQLDTASEDNSSKKAVASATKRESPEQPKQMTMPSSSFDSKNKTKDKIEEETLTDASIKAEHVKKSVKKRSETNSTPITHSSENSAIKSPNTLPVEAENTIINPVVTKTVKEDQSIQNPNSSLLQGAIPKQKSKSKTLHTSQSKQNGSSKDMMGQHRPRSVMYPSMSVESTSYSSEDTMKTRAELPAKEAQSIQNSLLQGSGAIPKVISSLTPLTVTSKHCEQVLPKPRPSRDIKIVTNTQTKETHYQNTISNEEINSDSENELQPEHVVKFAVPPPLKVESYKSAAPAPLQVESYKSAAPAPIKVESYKSAAPAPLQVESYKSAAPAPIKVESYKSAAPAPIKVESYKSAAPAPIKVESYKSAAPAPIKVESYKSAASAPIKVESYKTLDSMLQGIGAKPRITLTGKRDGASPVSSSLTQVDSKLKTNTFRSTLKTNKPSKLKTPWQKNKPTIQRNTAFLGNTKGTLNTTKPVANTKQVTTTRDLKELSDGPIRVLPLCNVTIYESSSGEDAVAEIKPSSKTGPTKVVGEQDMDCVSLSSADEVLDCVAAPSKSLVMDPSLVMEPDTSSRIETTRQAAIPESWNLRLKPTLNAWQSDVIEDNFPAKNTAELSEDEVLDCVAAPSKSLVIEPDTSSRIETTRQAAIPEAWNWLFKPSLNASSWQSDVIEDNVPAKNTAGLSAEPATADGQVSCNSDYQCQKAEEHMPRNATNANIDNTTLPGPSISMKLKDYNMFLAKVQPKDEGTEKEIHVQESSQGKSILDRIKAIKPKSLFGKKSKRITDISSVSSTSANEKSSDISPVSPANEQAQGSSDKKDKKSKKSKFMGFFKKKT